MYKHLRSILTAMATAALLLINGGCISQDDFDDTPSGNLEALWQIIDEHYCFLDYKQQALGIDWDEIHARYAARINPDMNRYQLFEVLAEMLAELRDGHVNLYTPADVGRNWSWKDDYPANFRADIQDAYLGTGYKIAASLKYRILEDNVAYVVCSSFSSGIGDGNLDELFHNLRSANGLILDLRDNGGGDLTNEERLAARFVDERRLTGYVSHKTGKGHNDFSSLEPRYLEPSSNIRWHKPVCVLTNRSVFSAANDFAVMMHTLPNVKLVGDHTGGGSGMPMSSSLPNGWGVRFSACPMYDAQKHQTEFGIDPDINVALTDEATAQGIDPIIEAARKVLCE